MKQRIIGKGLVVTVIILFIGVGIQPAFAVTPDISKSEDDCNLCPKKVSKQHYDKVEVMINILSGLLKKYPIVEDELQDLREIIKTTPDKFCEELYNKMEYLAEIYATYYWQGRLFAIIILWISLWVTGIIYYAICYEYHI